MATDTALLKALKEERARRSTGDNRGDLLLATLSPVQKAFALDNSRAIIARAGRRSGKSRTMGVRFIRKAIANANAPLLYMGPSQEQAMDIFWKPVVEMLDAYKISHTAKPSSKRIEFPNGANIKLLGTDSPNAMRRVRGNKYIEAAADEMAFSNGELDEFMGAVIPALSDYRGSMVLGSSPGPLPNGIFYQADVGRDKAQWSHHVWDLRQNPHFQTHSILVDPRSGLPFKDFAEEELYTICHLKFNGDFEHPTFRREYMGQWVFDNQSLVYPYDHEKWGALKAAEMPEMQYAIGIDLGVSSASAWVVVAYSPYSRHVYFVHAEKHRNMLVDEIAEKTRDLIDRFKPTFTLADEGGLGKVAVEEMRRRYGLPIMGAKKTEKTVHQSAMASDIVAGYVHACPGAQKLVDEWAIINKDPDTGDELKGQDNHCSDGAVYIYRRVYNALLQAETKPETEEERMFNAISTGKEDNYVY
jgi:hypothetical protein